MVSVSMETMATATWWHEKASILSCGQKIIPKIANQKHGIILSI